MRRSSRVGLLLCLGLALVPISLHAQQASGSNGQGRGFRLGQNYPNPFNPTTNINYNVPSNSNVSIKVYNELGKEIMTVVNGYKTTGNYTANVDMSSLASGIYFYTMTAGDFRDTKKMMLIK